MTTLSSNKQQPSTPPTAGEGELFDFGQECLDRIALSLGAHTVAAAAGSLLPVLMADPDWKKRHAALITIAQVGWAVCPALAGLGCAVWGGVGWVLRGYRGCKKRHAAPITTAQVGVWRLCLSCLPSPYCCLPGCC